jgi:hypothetical protein
MIWTLYAVPVSPGEFETQFDFFRCSSRPPALAVAPVRTEFNAIRMLFIASSLGLAYRSAMLELE